MSHPAIDKLTFSRVCLGFAVSVLCWAIYQVADAASGYRIDSCSVSTTGISFGTYDPASTTDNKNNSGNVTITCGTTYQTSGGTTATISLSAGNGTFAQRVMKSGTNTLNYNVYTDSAYSVIWGDAGMGSGTSNNSWAGTFDNFSTVSTPFTLYGKIPALQYNVVPGSYSDSLTVTVTY